MQDDHPGRRLTWPAFIAVAIAYVAIIQALGLLIGVDTGDDKSPSPTTQALVRNAVIPIGVSLLFAAGVATWLGWWRDIVRCNVPVRRWVWFFPISMVVVAIIAIDYGRLADQPVGFVLLLVVMTAMVGFTEELMSRGIGVNVFRRAGCSEGKVALWSSTVFGLVHLSNGIGEGPGAIAQRRSSPSPASSSTSPSEPPARSSCRCSSTASGTSACSPAIAGRPDPKASFGVFLTLVLQFVLIIVAIARRRHIAPPANIRMTTRSAAG